MPPSAFLLASIEPKSGTQAFSLLLPTDSLPEAQLSDQPTTTGSINWGLDAHCTGLPLQVKLQVMNCSGLNHAVVQNAQM